MQAGAHLSELPQSTQRASPRKRRQSVKQTCDRTVRSKWGAWCANVWDMVHLPRTELTVSATRAGLSALRAGNRTSKSEANGERQKMVWAWRTSRRSRRPLRSPPRPTTGSATHSSRRSRRPRAAAAQPASRLERFAAPPRRQPKAGRRSPAPKRRSAPRSPALPPISVALRPARRDLASARRRERRLSTALAKRCVKRFILS